MEKIKGFKQKIDKNKEVFVGLTRDSNKEEGLYIEIEDKKGDLPAVKHKYNSVTGIRTTTINISFNVLNFINNVMLTKYIDIDERSNSIIRSS